MLLGRTGDCGRLDELLAGARPGRSGVLVVRGDAGIGKSVLLGYARGQAPDFTVLEARALEGEAELAFSALADLLRPLLPHLDAIPAPQADALSGALALAPPVAGDRFAVAAGTLSLLGVAARERPVLALVDDAHWLDAASSETIRFAARRLATERVVLLFAVRTGEPSPFDRAGLDELVLEPLDGADAHALLRRHAAGIAGAVAGALVREADGNPLALTELPRSLTARQLSGIEPLPDPLPVRGGLHAAFSARLATYEPRTRAALVVAAAAGERVVAARAALPLLGRSVDDLAAAEADGILDAGGDRLAWRHPLLRSVAYAAGSPDERRAAHRALAEVTAGTRSAERTWHLAAATIGTDEHVARLLEEVAVDARARRGHAAAGEAYERAAELTPAGEERARRLLEAGFDYQAAGWIDRARALLDEAARETADPLRAADVAGQRGAVEMWGGDARVARRLLTTAAERVEAADPGRAAGLLLTAGLAAQISGDVGATLANARAAQALAGGVDEQLGRAIGNLLFNALILAGEAQEASALLPALLAVHESGDGLQTAATLGHGLVWIERLEEARRYFEAEIAAARDAGSLGFLPFLLACLAELDFREGRWDAAQPGAAESVRLAEETGQRNLLTFSLVTLARVEAGRGLDVDCRRNTARALELAGVLGAECIEVYALSVLGFLELGLGEAAAAVERLEQVSGLSALLGVGEPGVVPWRADLVEAYVLAGRLDDAERELATLEAEAARTERRWALAAAARCRGMLEDEGGLGHFERALALAAAGSPFERARTELRLGERLRRLRRPSEARLPLQRSRLTFEELGAVPWSARAGRELAAAGARSRRVTAGATALTAQEERIAVLVSEGGTNREIAAALFLSPKTVSYHLAKVFEKLGINSRSQLAAHVAATGLKSAARD